MEDMPEKISIVDLLSEIKSSNTNEHQTIVKSVDVLCNTITEHNGRLRKLEEWQNRIIGAIIIIGIIVTGLAFPIIIKAGTNIIKSAEATSP